MNRFVRAYGDRPRHLLALGASYLIAGYAWVRIFQHPSPFGVLAWFVGAIVAHDLVFLPLYTLAYRLAYRGARVDRSPRRRIPILRHLVAPAVVSAFLFLAWIPLILRLGFLRPITGLSPEPFLGRWALITAGLFLLSALAYGVRAVRARGLPEVVAPAETERGGAQEGSEAADPEARA